jgi:undecaprenyl-diphosphatase
MNVGGARVEAFDASADDALERWRGRSRSLDRLFHSASIVGDFSIVWHVTGVLVGLFIAQRFTEALWLSALIGLESLIVNQGVKRLFRRSRPTETGDERFTVRRPRTSSFPSGHASAAFFAATLLTWWVGWGWAPLWFAMAVVVAISRAWVRIHHPSDVVGGALTGLLLALLAIVTGLAGPLR